MLMKLILKKIGYCLWTELAAGTGLLSGQMSVGAGTSRWAEAAAGTDSSLSAWVEAEQVLKSTQ